MPSAAFSRGVGAVIYPTDILENVHVLADGDDRIFNTCLRQLETTGLVSGLVRRLSFGDGVLLQPELFDDYVGWLTLAAREEPDGLGHFHDQGRRRFSWRPAQHGEVVYLEDYFRHSGNVVGEISGRDRQARG